MIVTAALCWWNERPADLIECVRGMANIADRVVALDGAYRRHPQATVTSPTNQAKAIRRTAAEVGLACLILAPDRLWAGQIEKRTYLLSMAAVASDWIVVVDADHIVHADREAVRAELASLPESVDVITAPYPVPLNEARPLDDSAPTDWHRRSSGRADRHRLLFRALPGLRVEKRHWHVSGVKDGERVWVIHDDSGPGLPAAELTAHYEVEHRCLFRDQERVLASRAFCNDRTMIVEQTGQEDDLPGLPEPIFDYRTLPF